MVRKVRTIAKRRNAARTAPDVQVLHCATSAVRPYVSPSYRVVTRKTAWACKVAALLLFWRKIL